MDLPATVPVRRLRPETLSSGRTTRHVLTLSSALRPDLAAIGAVAALFYAFFLFGGYSKFFRDSDTGWHIRTGEMILRTGSLPHTDPFSFSLAGQPWVAWEWLSDVLMGAVHQSMGLTGVAALYGLAIATGVWLWFRLNWDLGGNFILASMLASPMLSTCNIHWLARPHVLSWVFLLAAVRFCVRLEGRLSRGQMAGVALATAIWTNIHASFFFAVLIPAVWALGSWMRGLIWDVPDESDRTRGYMQTALIAAAASFLNPYGWSLHWHILRYLTDRNLLDRVGEFQSFNFHVEGAIPITIALSVGMAGAAFSLGVRRVEWALLSGLLVAASLRSARTLPMMALVALPFANAAITEVLRSAKGLRPQVRGWIDGFLNYGDRLRVLDSRNNGVLAGAAGCAALVALLAAPGIQAKTGFPRDQFPVEASAAVAKLPADARLFAPDKFGGYLIYKFNGNRKVFFDGRSDFYGAGFLKDYGRIVQARPGWQRLFQSFGCTYALLPDDSSLVGALEGRGWKVLHRDATATLLMAPGSDQSGAN